MRKLAYLALLLGALGPHLAWSQTPSPLQEWQYSGGSVLQEVYDPNLPTWRVDTGLAAEVEPVYSGASASRIYGGPIVNIHYKNQFFFSTGEGLGYNFLHGEFLDQFYRVGISVGYDGGRREADDRANLHGLGQISVAPAVKLYGTYVISKEFPLVIQGDVRQIVLGGADGTTGDLEFYMPLPGSSKNFVVFVGPSITWASASYLQKEFGVNQFQALASDHPVFDAHGGTNSVGLGISATKLFGHHWMLNANGAYSRLRGSAAESPITESRVQRAATLSLVYHW